MNNLKEREEPVFLVVCSYCNRQFNKSRQKEYAVATQSTSTPLFVSHGTCPDCLLENFPNEYLRIQKESRLRIKRLFQKKYKEIRPEAAN